MQLFHSASAIWLVSHKGENHPSCNYNRMLSLKIWDQSNYSDPKLLKPNCAFHAYAFYMSEVGVQTKKDRQWPVFFKRRKAVGYQPLSTGFFLSLKVIFFNVTSLPEKFTVPRKSKVSSNLFMLRFMRELLVVPSYQSSTRRLD